MSRVAACNYCQAPILWTTTASGNRMPVDATPARNGNVHVDPATLAARVRCRGWQREGWARWPAHVHHATTCPHAAEWNPAMAKARGRAPDVPQPDQEALW